MSMAGRAGLRRELERLADGDVRIDTLVVWPGESTSTVVKWLEDKPRIAERVFLPSSSLDALPDPLSSELRERLYFSYPYTLPGAYHPRAYRVRSWMRYRRLEITHPRIQLNTY